MPPAMPITNVDIPDPTTVGEPERDAPPDDATGHAAFEKAETERGT